MSVYFCNHLDWEDRADCFPLTVFLMSYDSQCSVAIPHDAVGWSVLCDCDHIHLLFTYADKSFLKHCINVHDMRLLIG